MNLETLEIIVGAIGITTAASLIVSNYTIVPFEVAHKLDNNPNNIKGYEDGLRRVRFNSLGSFSNYYSTYLGRRSGYRMVRDRHSKVNSDN